MKPLPVIGDSIVVDCLAGFRATVERVVCLPDATIRIDLDWGEHGKSFVCAHDEGSVWHRLEDFN